MIKFLSLFFELLMVGLIIVILIRNVISLVEVIKLKKSKKLDISKSIDITPKDNKNNKEV